MSRWTCLHRTAVAALLLCTAFPLAVTAQSHPPGSIGIYFDPAGTQSTLAWSFTPPVGYIHAYVVVFDLPESVRAVEFGVYAPFGAATGTGFGWVSGVSGWTSWCDPAPVAICMGPFWPYETCIPAGEPVVLADITITAFRELNDYTICVGPSAISSFNPPQPGYAPCATPSELRTLAIADGGCAVVNAAVPDGGRTWGALKALFEGQER